MQKIHVTIAGMDFICYNIHHKTAASGMLSQKEEKTSWQKKRNIIVGQSGGPTAVINSSLAGVYKNAIERGFDKVYGMLHGIQGLLDEQYVDLSTQIHSELDIELLKRTPSAFLGSLPF